MKHLLAITDPGCAASTRYRVTQFEDFFKSRGVQMEVIPCPREKSEIARLLDAVKLADVVVIQRFLPRPALFKQLRRHARRLVYDFDDAVIYAESAQRKSRLKLRRWWRFRRVLRDCDTVTAGNAYLAGLASIHAGEGRVFTVPTVVDVNRYEHEPTPAATAPILGWIGGRWTLPYLEQLSQPLTALAAAHPDLYVRIIADELPKLHPLRLSLSPWSETTEIRDLKSLTIGLAPLPDDSWTRGKCGLRLLQYLAAGIPAVAAPVGTQADIIRHGAALSASTDEEWRSATHQLLTQPHAAAALVARGKEVVRKHYSLATWAPRLFDLWCG